MLTVFCAPAQIEFVEDQTGIMDPKTNFRLIIVQTELERFKFLVRSFLRARMAKVCIPSDSLCSLFPPYGEFCLVRTRKRTACLLWELDDRSINTLFISFRTPCRISRPQNISISFRTRHSFPRIIILRFCHSFQQACKSSMILRVESVWLMRLTNTRLCFVGR